MPFAPPVQVIRNNPDEIRTFMQGMEQFARGLEMMGQAKQQQANQQYMSLLGSAVQSGGSPNALNYLIGQEPPSRPGGLAGFMDRFNPMTPSRGMSPVQQQFIGQQVQNAADLYRQARIISEQNRGNYWKQRGETSQDPLDQAKKIEAAIALLNKQRKRFFDESGYVMKPNSEKPVAKIDQRIKILSDQVAEITGTALTDEEIFEQDKQLLEQSRLEDDQSYQPVELTPRTETLSRINKMSDADVNMVLKNLLPKLSPEEQAALQRGLDEGDSKKLRRALYGLIAPSE